MFSKYLAEIRCRRPISRNVTGEPSNESASSMRARTAYLLRVEIFMGFPYSRNSYCFCDITKTTAICQ